jgi:hypothetical protein
MRLNMNRRLAQAWVVLSILLSIVFLGCGSRETPIVKKSALPFVVEEKDTGAPRTTGVTPQVIVAISKVQNATVKNELLASTGVMQATFGDPEGGWSTIDKIDQDAAKAKALGAFATFHVWIANIRAAQGDYADGRKAYEFGRRAALSIASRGHGGGDMIISMIKETSPEQWEAKARLADGSTTGSVNAALKIKDPREKERVLADILKAQVKAGQIPEAKETLKHIESKGERWRCLEAIAIAQSRAGDIAGATDTIKQIEVIANGSVATDPKREFYFSRPSALALAALASAQSKAGDAEAAKRSLAAAHQLAGEVYAVTAGGILQEMTRTQLELQDQVGAKQTFAFWEQLLETRQQELRQAFGMWNESHKTLAMKLAEAGQVDDSKRVLAKINKHFDKPPLPEGAAKQNDTSNVGVDEDAIAAIIRTQLSRGDTKEALDALEPIADTARGTMLREDIVKALLQANDYDTILNVAEKVPDVTTRFWLLIRGDVAARVPGALDTAAKIARQIPDPPGMKQGQARDNALRWVVQRQAEAGDLAAARQTLMEINDSEERTTATQFIAKAETAGTHSRRESAEQKQPAIKQSDLIARFEAAHSLADWQGSADLQGQFWDQVSAQINNGNIADAQRTLRKLVQLAARQFRTWAVNAELHSSLAPKE